MENLDKMVALRVVLPNGVCQDYWSNVHQEAAKLTRTFNYTRVKCASI